MRAFFLIFSGLLSSAIFSLAPMTVLAETTTTLDDQSEVAITIYNEDLALVRDRREVHLPAGESRLAFREVSARIRPETALLRTDDDASALRVIAQSFDFALLTADSLLEKYVGRQVLLVRTHPTTGQEQTREASVLAYNDGSPVLQVGDRIEVDAPGRIVFPDLPDSLRDRPTLIVQLDNPHEGRRALELSYLTEGLSWQADYVAQLNNDDDRLELSGWVTLANRSGTLFSGAQVQLVAGDIHQVRDKTNSTEARPRMAMALQAGAPQEEGLFEYHLYTLTRPTTLRDNQNKQVNLLPASDLPVRKDFVLRGSQQFYTGRYGDPQRDLKVGAFITFENRKQDGLGVPLPRGTVRVYQDDAQGTAQFIGEDRIDHTPVNEEVRLRLGAAFDVTAEKVQTDFHRPEQDRNQPRLTETAWRIILKNASSEAVRVRVEEPIPGDWTILEENFPHHKETSTLATWEIDVPAEDQVALEYRVRIRH